MVLRETTGFILTAAAITKVAWLMMTFPPYIFHFSLRKASLGEIDSMSGSEANKDYFVKDTINFEESKELVICPTGRSFDDTADYTKELVDFSQDHFANPRSHCFSDFDYSSFIEFWLKRFNLI